jgi:hypothetical protein
VYVLLVVKEPFETKAAFRFKSIPYPPAVVAVFIVQRPKILVLPTSYNCKYTELPPDTAAAKAVCQGP